MREEDYILVYIKTVVLWDKAPCIHVENDARFRGNYFPTFSATKRKKWSEFFLVLSRIYAKLHGNAFQNRLDIFHV